jgi:hypothetical protein
MADAPFDPGTQVRINSLLDLTTGRIARTDPIHQAALAMATRLAPTYARNAMTAPSSAPPINMGAAGSGGGSGVPVAGTAIAAAIAAMLAKGGASSAGGDLGALINGLKRLFGRGGPSTVQGNQPNAGGSLMGPNTTGVGYDQPPQVSWSSGLPWEQPFLPSDPGYFTGFSGTPRDPSGGSGVGPGMQAYYNGGSSEPVDWWKP